MPKNARRYVGVLQGRHVFSILVARVEKPTDNEGWAVIRDHD
jgi:hypothetical protein